MQALRGRDGIVPKAITVIFTLAVGVYIGKLGLVVKQGVTGYRAVARNFYGQLRVIDEGKPNAADAYRKLLHGRVNHGIQMLNPKYRRTPVAYFCTDSGIGKAMRSREAGQRWDMGILGLGAGALAAYGQAGDTIHLYEINPLVLDLARSQFTYLADTPAKVDVSLGDGRLSLEREPNEKFDLLVMDAFSGDSVPVHLITREAFAMYFEHLKPGGMVAVNISNRYLDLEPVMERAGTAFGKKTLDFDLDPEADDLLCNVSSWVLFVDPQRPLPDVLRFGRVLPPHPGFKIWTDDFSNMFSILK
jgi:hypothetical protein